MQLDNAAPTPLSETSASTINCLDESGFTRTGADVKKFWSSEKAVSASGVHQKEGTFVVVN